LASSAALIAQNQLLVLTDDQKMAEPTCRSVPTLCCHLTLPEKVPIHPTSAPASPQRQEIDRQSRKCKDTDSDSIWSEATPLLRITSPKSSSETCV